MSSRNVRLTNEEKETAAELYKSLTRIEKELRTGKIQELKEKAIKKLEDAGFKIDYLEIATSTELRIVEDITSRKGLIILIAAFLSNVRLIDNLIVEG